MPRSPVEDVEAPRERTPSRKKRGSFAEPKRSFPVKLNEQLRDTALIVCILYGISLYGAALSGLTPGQHAAHVEHSSLNILPRWSSHIFSSAHEPRKAELWGRRLAEEADEASGVAEPPHAHSVALDMKVTLGIVVVLVCITIGFEMGKSALEEAVPSMMMGILNAMWGELTVLGFIGLVAYFALRLGVLAHLSVAIYGEPAHLIHLFEEIHFMFFFVMLTFLAEAIILVRATLKAEAFWRSVEAFIGGQGYPPPGSATAPPRPPPPPPPAPPRLLATYHASRTARRLSNCLHHAGGALCNCVLWRYREAEAVDELRYALLRDRFISPPKPEKVPLPGDFDFAAYLRRRCVDHVAHVLHLSPATWASLIGIGGGVYGLHTLGVPIGAYGLVFFGWALWLASRALQRKLLRIVHMLTPPHALLDGPPPRGTRASKDNGGTSASPYTPLPEETHDGAAAAPPPYESLSPTRECSKHESLFWRGRAGPETLLFLMRLQMLFAAVSLAEMWSWIIASPDDTSLLLLGFLPILHVIISAPKAILPMLVVATSVESMKKSAPVNETLVEMSTERTLKMLRMLSTLEAQAKRARKLVGEPKPAPSPPARKGRGLPRNANTPPKKKRLGAAEEAELRQAFALFDADGSGSIDISELDDVMASLGLSLTDVELANLMAQMDVSGDGVVDFAEFADVMATDIGEAQTPAAMAASIFKLMDTDGSGEVSTSEFKASLMSLNPSITDEDVAAALNLFDIDHDGMISKVEFVRAIELMKTFE